MASPYDVVALTVTTQRKMQKSKTDAVPDSLIFDVSGVVTTLQNPRGKTYREIKDKVSLMQRRATAETNVADVINELGTWLASCKQYTCQRTTNSLDSAGQGGSGSMGGINSTPGTLSGMGGVGGMGSTDSGSMDNMRLNPQMLERMITAGATMALQQYQQQRQQQPLAISNGGIGDNLSVVRQMAAQQLIDEDPDEIKNLAVAEYTKLHEDSLTKEAAEKMCEDPSEELLDTAAQKLIDEADDDDLTERAVEKMCEDPSEELLATAAQKLVDEADNDDDLTDRAVEKMCENPSEELLGVAAQKLIDEADDDDLTDRAVEKIVNDMPFDVLKEAYKKAKRARKSK
mmetsp:Transcript_137120/g.238328  ORF Transcript_137120/g.238328 Transcript_137120/m.238328 type:complete len:345 (+) Transcript_137120:76-1110(+)